MRWPPDLRRNTRRQDDDGLHEAKELSQKEFRRLLEKRVQESFDMSLTDFTAALSDGRLDPESPRVAGLAILLGARTS
jgi:hypothetical protein